MRRVLVWLCGALLACGIAVLFWQHTPAGGGEIAAHEFSAAPRPGGLTAAWFGVTALLLDDGAHALLIDPFFTRPPGLLPVVLNRPIAPDTAAIRVALEQAGITRLDAVLVSHSHYDHAMDAGVVARLTGASLVGSESTANIGRGAGLPEAQLRVVRSGEPLVLGSFTVTFIESRHAGKSGGRPTGSIAQPLIPPARYLDYRLGGAWSILVEHAQGSVLHHGSAGYVAGALQGRHADVAFLGVALVDDLKAYLHETVDAVGAHRVVPVHWDDFTRPLDRPLRPFPWVVDLPGFFRGMQARPDLAVQTLPLARRVELFPK